MSVVERWYTQGGNGGREERGGSEGGRESRKGTYVVSTGLEEGEDHAAADDDLVDLIDERLNHSDLGGDLEGRGGKEEGREGGREGQKYDMSLSFAHFLHTHNQSTTNPFLNFFLL